MAPQQSTGPAKNGPRDPPEYEEITLGDIVRVLHARKITLGIVFLLVVSGGIGYTLLATPEYEAQATLVPLNHEDIIKNWLDSRHAAQLVVESVGSPLKAELYPGRWDDTTGVWDGQEPSDSDASAKLAEAVQIQSGSGPTAGPNERLLRVVVTLSDPVMTADVANRYLDTLDLLRPQLENITRQQAFDQYYDGSNEQEAQRRAEVTAKQQNYWIELDDARIPPAPVSPNVTLNIALSVALGLVLGVFAVLFSEWLSNYRTETKRLHVPDELRLEDDGTPATPGERGGTGPRRRYS